VTVTVRLGEPVDVDVALSIYERSNLARRGGDWPGRAERVRQVATMLRDPGAWFLLAHDGPDPVAMALVSPFRADGGRGADLPGEAFLNLIYVLPERWGEGIGGRTLDAVIEESARRGTPRIHLWTHERDNERAQRLYARRGFLRTGATLLDEAGDETAEWVRDGSEPAVRHPPSA
jgi:GNAT superfamily N-acetyltransferase